MSRKTFDTGSGTVAYWVDAASRDADDLWLVFLPGLTADHTLFDAQIAHFVGKARCLVWDAPAHGESRPYPLDFTMDDYARILHEILQVEGCAWPVLVGQSLGGYVAQAYIDLYPGQVAGFVGIDTAPLKRVYYPSWEIKALRHTKGMYTAIPWGLLKPWGTRGAATSAAGRANMRSFMDSYSKTEYVELAAHGYKMLADAVEAERAYDIDCPALLLCGEKDHAGDVKPFNRKWAAGEGIELVWVPGAGHNSNVDAPAFVNVQLERFVAGIAAEADRAG
ncbi:MAG: alpha/beta hydrolase [Coriobacteriales bacterium]|nr:alpha/beta hydrolase [Coriobacteriales bacterium]